MTEHRIRLAMAWSQCFANLPPRRVDLPVRWTNADRLQPFDLKRSFQRPATDPSSQWIELELSDVPGLQTVEINGQRLDIERAGGGELTRVRFEALLQPGRNHLNLVVDLTGVDLDRIWGKIALVIVGDPG